MENIDIIRSRFNEDYLRILSIFDHLIECTEKYKAYKLEAINKDFCKEELFYELNKELMDLKILLDIHSEKNFDIYLKRLHRFAEKIIGGI